MPSYLSDFACIIAHDAGFLPGNDGDLKAIFDLVLLIGERDPMLTWRQLEHPLWRGESSGLAVNANLAWGFRR